MLRGLERGWRARVSGQEHGARRGPGTRGRSQRGGWRHMAGRVSDWWLSGPPQPPGCQSLLPDTGPARDPWQKGTEGGGEPGRGKEPQEGST
jgi:hypothetical protein